MAESKIGPNLQAGAGFLAKRVQKSLNRAQEKVGQRNQLCLAGCLKLTRELQSDGLSSAWRAATCSDRRGHPIAPDPSAFVSKREEKSTEFHVT